MRRARVSVNLYVFGTSVAVPSVDLFDPRLLQLLYYLTRRQAWLSPHEIAKEFRVDGSPFTARTIHRWFQFLREKGSFVYYPYPRANVLGLQDVLVRIRGLRNPAILGILPFAASFNVELGLQDSTPFVSQGYWVPVPFMAEFQEYWRAARDLGLLASVEIFRSRNMHFIYSPFHEFITASGVAEFHGPADNRYFEILLKRHLKEAFEVRIGDRIAKAPLTIPVAVEHIWSHCSSRQVWQEIRATGEASIRHFAKGRYARAFDRPGAALRLLQQQWTTLVQHYDEVFLQPRVFFDWTVVKNAIWVSIMLEPGTIEKFVDTAIRVSQRSIVTQLRPGAEFENRAHLLCFAPSDQLLPILKEVREHHFGHEPPFAALMDKQATLDLFQPTFCKLDWRLFDPDALAWQFDGDAYLTRLKSLRAA